MKASLVISAIMKIVCDSIYHNVMIDGISVKVEILSRCRDLNGDWSQDTVTFAS